MKAELCKPLLFLALSVLAGSASASEVKRYMLEMTVWIEGERREAPVLIIDSGEPTSIDFEGAEGRRGWKIEVQVNPPGPGEGAPEGAIWMDFSIHRQEDGQWEHLADSMLGIHEGRTGTLSVASEDGQASPENSLVYVEVLASRLRPGEQPR